LSENIQKSVVELNQKLSITKESISKVKDSTNIQSQPFMPNPHLLNLQPSNRFKQFSLELEKIQERREHSILHRLCPQHHKENFLGSQSKSPINPLNNSSRKSPMSLMEYLQTLDPRNCNCKAKPEPVRYDQKVEKSAEKRSTDQKSSWITDGGIEIRLNKADRLRKEYIRSKNITPTRVSSFESSSPLAANAGDKLKSFGKWYVKNLKAFLAWKNWS